MPMSGDNYYLIFNRCNHSFIHDTVESIMEDISMKKIFRNPMFWVLFIEITIVVVMIISGFKIVYPSSMVQNDWYVIGVITQIFGVIATFGATSIALFIAIKDNYKSIKMKTAYSIVGDEYVLKVYNSGKSPVFISEINFTFGNYSLGRLYCEDNVETCIAFENFIAKGQEILTISMPKVLFQSQLQGFVDRDLDVFTTEHKIKNEKLIIQITDFEGKRYISNTNVLFQDYLKMINS